uniref:dTDP-glucose 4,6-dehydratase n=1 Tax=Magnetococcus massalia (strain MO-1) TaxID=451514 RepID=A0A1S7LEW4_MAGMO|nr:dTDP-glucose 4,6-dehydratase [Candidatus Magnetococcus massalia]
MASLLVTGGAGFIGCNFTQLWAERHPQDRLVVLDALTYAGRRGNLAPCEGAANFRFVHGDIADEPLVESLLREEGIDTLVNFAAESHVDRSIDGPDAFLQTNVMGTHGLLKAAKKVWLDAGSGKPHRFHHISTDEVYGSLSAEEAPFTEASPYAPNSPYSASKASADHLVRAYHHTYGLQTTTSNCSNNYGPYQFPEKLIPLLITHILQGKPLPIYGDGLNVRDWLYVTDHCLGIEAILQRGQVGEVYNIGGDHGRSNLEIVQQICQQMDSRFSRDESLCQRFPDAPQAKGDSAESLIRYVTDRPGHDRRYAIDASKLEHRCGFKPREAFATGLEKTIDWYLAQQG